MIFLCILVVVIVLLPNHPDEVDDSDENVARPRLVIITSTTRPFYLSKSHVHVNRLRSCFDVQWIVVHMMESLDVAAAPFFRDVFPWIKELRAVNPGQAFHHVHYGRNLAIKFIGEHVTGSGFVYFADDDNVLPELCSAKLYLSAQNFYYADQSHCGASVNPISTKEWSLEPLPQIACRMGTGSFLVPLSLVREASTTVLWDQKQVCGSDPSYFASLIKRWRERRGASHIARLNITLYFKHINVENGCEPLPWTSGMLRASMEEHTLLLDKMSVAQRGLLPSERQKQPHLTFNSYTHILSTIRSVMPHTRTVHYLEIGVWKGATSLLMSRHSLPTTVTGVDTFSFKNQRTEAEVIKRSLPGNGSIQWIHSHSLNAINATRDALQRFGAPGFDIVFLDGDYSTKSSIHDDFGNFSSLVAPGGYVVVNNFLETKGSPYVRETLWSLVRDGAIASQDLEVIGVVENVAGAKHEFKKGVAFDWQSSTSNVFIFRKKR